MIGDTLEYNGTTYTIKKDITFGEYRKINKVTSNLGLLAKKYGDDELTDLSVEQQTEVFNEFSSTSEQQMQMIVEFLEETLGLSQDDIDNMTLAEAGGLFNETFKQATMVKKNSKPTSSSPYS